MTIHGATGGPGIDTSLSLGKDLKLSVLQGETGVVGGYAGDVMLLDFLECESSPELLVGRTKGSLNKSSLTIGGMIIAYMY